MSEITVVGGAIEEMAARLSSIPGEVDGCHEQVATHASAAQGTPAHDAMTGLMAHWAAMLPHYSDASASLHTAMLGAARNYTQSDAYVGAAAGTSAPVATAQNSFPLPPAGR
jgi:hypothetical protein